MEITIEESPVIQKTKELCQTILNEPSIRSIRQRIDTFMEDEHSRSQYEGLVTRGQELQEKQQNAIQLTSEEISTFEEQREALLNNPVAKAFLDAQEELHQVQQSIHKYVKKTLELGRMPEEDDLAEGSCGHGGCGCHGH
jgi:cell fate (sporulation/competence/biofilm development) regulator YlbF (YheA/YmcA/DUF963 family)